MSGAAQRRVTRRVTAIVLLAVLALGSACSQRDGHYEVTAFFTRTHNLFDAARVRVLGVEVGLVESIDYPPGSDGVQVRLRIRDDVRLPADATATIVSSALLGERFVELGPTHTDGPALEDGDVIPLARTDVPAEFDEVLRSLNDFIADLPPDEVARLLDNLAGVLDGQGDELGATIDEVAGAIEVLRANDDAVVALVSRVADLNEVLATRDREIGAFIDDWAAVLGLLADERDALDGALRGVARLSTEVADLLADHRGDLAADVRALTRLGRTSRRNLDHLDLLLHGQSEVYRHAQRVFDFERNWLPLVNHSEDLGRVMADRLRSRLVDACRRLELTGCADPAFWDGRLPAEVCFEPVALCPGHPARPDEPPDPDPPATLSEALDAAIEAVPELPERLLEEREHHEAADAVEVVDDPLRTATGVVP